jgi:hypothetical protein
VLFRGPTLVSQQQYRVRAGEASDFQAGVNATTRSGSELNQTTTGGRDFPFRSRRILRDYVDHPESGARLHPALPDAIEFETRMLDRGVGQDVARRETQLDRSDLHGRLQPCAASCRRAAFSGPAWDSALRTPVQSATNGMGGVARREI